MCCSSAAFLLHLRHYRYRLISGVVYHCPCYSSSIRTSKNHIFDVPIVTENPQVLVSTLASAVLLRNFFATLVLALNLLRHLLCHHVGHHFLKLPFLIALTDSVPSPSPHPAPDLIPGGCEVDIARSCDSLQQVLRHMYVCLCASVDACI